MLRSVPHRMLSLGPDDPLIHFITNPVLGFVLTLVTSAAVASSVRPWPNDKSFWQDVFDWPGKVIVGVSLTTGLVGALPRLVWEPGEFRCNAAGCWVEGGGDQVIEGTGLGAFLVQPSDRCSPTFPSQPPACSLDWD